MKPSVAVLVAVLGCWLCAATVKAQSSAAPIVAIAPQPLAQALAALARQTGLQIVYVTGAVSGAASKGAPTGLTVRQALTRLLEGTGLAFEFLNDRTVRIFLPINPEPAYPIGNSAPLPGAGASVAVTPPADGSVVSKRISKRGQAGKKRGEIFGHIGGFFALCGPLLAAGPEFCQTPPSNVQSDATSDILQEVVVTAERRAENVQKTPIAVTAVTGGQLKDEQVRQINDLSVVAPSLSVVNQGNYQLIMMRGVGNTLGEAPVTTGVPVIMDGMANPRGTGLSAPFFDLADIELLRGPQGTFIGSNSTGGAIQITSVNPNFRGINGYATAQVGNYHDNLAEAAVNLPVDDTFAMRLAIHTEQENSFYSEQGVVRREIPYASQSTLDPGNTDERSVRLGALWKPTGDFQLLLKVQYDENNTDGIPYNVNPRTFAPLPGLGCPYSTSKNGRCYSQYYANYSGNPWILNYSTFSKYENWDRFYTGEARYSLGNGDVLRLFAGSEASQSPEIDPNCDCSADDGYSLGGSGVDAAEPVTNDNVEINLISPDIGKLQWIIGSSLVYSNTAISQYTYTTGPAPETVAAPEIQVIPASEESRELGVFGQIAWQFIPTLRLQAGLRGNWDNNFGTGTVAVYPAGSYVCATNPCVIPSSSPAVYLDNRGLYRQNHQTGKIGLNWQPGPNEFVYAFYARGYKPGLTQFHAFGTVTPNAQAETLDDFELGWKGTYLDRHVTTQVDGYYDRYYGMQQNIFNPVRPQNGGVSNVPEATIEGIEANMQMQLGALGVNVSAAYTHSALAPLIDVATYKEPPTSGLGADLPQCPPDQASTTLCTNYTPYIVNLGGEQNPYAPALTANITVQYGFRIGAASLQPRVQFSHTDKQYASLFQSDPYYEISARNLWSGYLDFIDGNWRTGLYGTNLSNETYETDQAGSYVLYGPRRQYGVQATRTF